MIETTQIVLPFASLAGKKLQADFNGGALSSDGGVLFLRETEAQVGVISRFAQALKDPRDPRYIDHSDIGLKNGCEHIGVNRPGCLDFVTAITFDRQS